VRRFEACVIEAAGDYNRALVRRSRRVCERADRSVPAQLAVIARHQLKCAYYSEQIRDDENALRHYHQAQEAVRALPATATTACELKEVAYVLCFKIVRLLLGAAKPQEAVDQFHAHMQVWGCLRA
jgi:hypothetical protein